MNIRQYFYLAKRWIWLAILGLALGATGGYVFSMYQIPIYQTVTKVMVSSSPNGLTSNPYAIYADQQLALTYVQILTTQPLLDKTSEYVGYKVSASQITAQQADERSPIITITVEDADPQKAADVANRLVQVLIEQNESLQAGQYAASEESLQVQINQVEEQVSNLQSELDNLSTQSLSEQIAQVKSQMEPLQAEVSQLQKDIALLTPAWSQERKVKVAEMQSRLDQLTPLLNLYQQIYTNLVVLGSPGSSVENNSLMVTRLQSTLQLYQQIYLNLINSREAIRLARLQNTPNVVQLETARVPTAPVRPQPLTDTLMAGLIGFMLAVGYAFAVEYLDDTIKTPEDVERELGLHVIAYIAEMQGAEASDEFLYVARQPRSPVSEAFRSLRANLEFASVDKPLHTILVTSPGPGEGKTTIAANLAAIIAQAGRSALLMDADMRRPRVHRVLGIPNRIGLSDLFRERVPLRSVYSDWKESAELSVITSGSLPPNPAELLGSERMSDILDEATKSVNTVVIDSPPTLVADAQVLAARVDGIVFVIRPGVTRRDAARAAYEQFQRAGGRVLGCVFNRIPRDREHYYSGYRYYSSYYSGSYYYYAAGESHASGNGKRPWLGIFGGFGSRNGKHKKPESLPEQPPVNGNDKLKLRKRKRKMEPTAESERHPVNDVVISNASADDNVEKS